MGKKAKSQPHLSFVLDNSVTMGWAFEDETDPYAEAIADCLPDVRAFVPGHWRLEVANALLVGERRKRTTEAKVVQFLTLLESFPFTVDDQTSAKAWHDTLHLARSHGLSVYDAAYLAKVGGDDVKRGRGSNPVSPIWLSLDAELKAAPPARHLRVDTSFAHDRVIDVSLTASPESFSAEFENRRSPGRRNSRRGVLISNTQFYRSDPRT